MTVFTKFVLVNIFLHIFSFCNYFFNFVALSLWRNVSPNGKMPVRYIKTPNFHQQFREYLFTEFIGGSGRCYKKNHEGNK